MIIELLLCREGYYNPSRRTGYSESEIRSIKVQHSFLNVILRYQEWNIMVEIEDEPTVFYHYGFGKNAEVSQGGVSGSGDKEKEELKHLER